MEIFDNLWAFLGAYVGAVWYTWLGFLGLVAGFGASSVLGTPLVRSGLVGFVAGMVLVTIVNVLDPNPTPCLQNSKRWDILRAYSLSCEDPNANLIRK